MKFRLFTPIFVLVGLALQSAVIRADETLVKAADNKIYAENLVNQLKADNPELIWAGIHAAAPGSKDYRIIASTLNVIGKKSEHNDIDAATEGRSHLTPNLEEEKLGIMMPLQDSSGAIVGALGLAFKYHAGDDQAKAYTKASAIRDQLAKRIADRAALFKATSE